MTRKHSKKHWNSENIVLKLGASQMTQIHEKKKCSSRHSLEKFHNFDFRLWPLQINPRDACVYFKLNPKDLPSP